MDWLLILEVPASILFAAQIDIKVVKRKRSASPAQAGYGNEIPNWMVWILITLWVDGARTPDKELGGCPANRVFYEIHIQVS
jgi:hypothetical protein